jgi:hypothetical protein
MTLKPVLERVRELQAELAQAILVDAAALHRDWSEMWRADIAAIIEEQTGAYKPIHQWPAIWRRMLCHLDVRFVLLRTAGRVVLLPTRIGPVDGHTSGYPANEQHNPKTQKQAQIADLRVYCEFQNGP